MVRPRPEPLTYYLDENVDGPDMAGRLKAAGLICQQHRDCFNPGDADADWIPIVAERGWAIVTRDLKIRKNAAERAAWISAGAIVLMLRGEDLGTPQMSSALITAHVYLEAYIAKRQPPMIIHVSPDGGFKRVEGGERRGGIRKD